MPKFSTKLSVIANDTNTYLRKIFLKKKEYSHLTNPMKYSIFSGGKRIRSAVIVNTGKIFNIDYKKLITVGSAVECIHTYSLIHDDLPAMDNDDLRRGKLSNHKKFNEFTAILAGNSLLTLAFEILSSERLSLSPGIKNELVLNLAIYSGFSGLAGGQYFDLTFENKKISKKKIIDIQKNKTGKLFAFCCECAGIIKKLDAKERRKLREVGLDIGLLFQLTDDLIDSREINGVAGKSINRDKTKGKPTLVNLFGYKKTLYYAYDLERKIINKIKNYGIKSIDLLELVAFIMKRKF